MFSVLIQKWPSTDLLSNHTAPYLHIQIHLLVHAQVRFCLSTNIVLSKLILFPLDNAHVFQLPQNILIESNLLPQIYVTCEEPQQQQLFQGSGQCQLAREKSRDSHTAWAGTQKADELEEEHK